METNLLNLTVIFFKYQCGKVVSVEYLFFKMLNVLF